MLNNTLNVASCGCLQVKEFLISRIRTKVRNISITMTIFGCGAFVLFQESAAVAMKHLSDNSLSLPSCSRQLINSKCLPETACISLINLIIETLKADACEDSITKLKKGVGNNVGTCTCLTTSACASSL